jgi:hypothetical protein
MRLAVRLGIRLAVHPGGRIADIDSELRGSPRLGGVGAHDSGDDATSLQHANIQNTSILYSALGGTVQRLTEKLSMPPGRIT